MGNSLNELQDLKQEIEKKLEHDSQNEEYQKELDEINGKIEKNQIIRRYFNGNSIFEAGFLATGRCYGKSVPIDP